MMMNIKYNFKEKYIYIFYMDNKKIILVSSSKLNNINL